MNNVYLGYYTYSEDRMTIRTFRVIFAKDPVEAEKLLKESFLDNEQFLYINETTPIQRHEHTEV